ncbi:hypothetical protein BC936DRAFT_139957 [Jimgerdemannia flammicorona]|uniref:Protein kinase domain-containing protein n=1 Tax=Jimgerdemannia flammicorona TaxID=994334 RepID=A0A433B912_9FUNG|nr:hypothetical protein BC936DRAFT_139957 [Jimgerdemannia flammicorona]
MLTVKINTGEQLQFIGDFPEETPQVFRDTVKQCLAFDPFFRPSLSSVRDAFDNFIVIAPAPMDLPFTVCDDTPRSLLSPTFNNSEISDLRADVGDDKINALSEPQKELFEIAMHLYEDGKFTSAIERFQSPTLFWVTLAQRMVVHCHKAIGKNPSEVFQAFKGLAERSDARGQFCLAWCYDHRYGTQQDTKLAFRWYSSSMRAGNLAAAAVLRDMKWIENLYDVVVQWSTDASVFDFLRELFKSDDSRTFAITVLKCAREGDVRARYIYVIAYYSGSLLHHVDEHGRIYSELDDKFLISGGESFTIVVELSIYGNEMAQSEVERRIETAESDSNAGINFSESFRLLFEAAKKENSESPFCQRLIALCYELGVGVEKDVSKSLAFNSAAANAGDVRAQYKQFLQYQLGEGTEAHPELAFTWGLSAADTGRLGGQPRLGELHYDSIGATQSINLFSTAALAKAMYCLGRAHFYGRGANLDERAACRWFSRAANAGNADALWWAGLCHLHGHGTATDPQAAYAFFLKAADEGHAWAMYYVGEEYIEGNYLGRDLVKAKEYMAKAADGDINDAIMALRRPPLAEPAAEPAGEEASAPASNDPWQVLQKPNEPMPNEPMPNELTPDEPMPNEPMPDEPIPDEPIYPDESMIALPVYPDEAPPVYPHETPPANWAMVALRAPQPPANRLVLGLRAPSGGQSLSSTPKKRKFRFFWKRR